MFEADETEDMQSLWEEDGLLTMQEVSYADPRAQQTPAEFFESLGLSASVAAALAENPDAPATSANLSAFTDAVQAPAEPEIGMEDDLVAITCADADAVIYYTMDGSEPTVNSTHGKQHAIHRGHFRHGEHHHQSRGGEEQPVQRDCRVHRWRRL